MYRGIQVKLPADTYAVGKTITWQPLSSASKSQTVPLTFIKQEGYKLYGSYFVIESNGAKEIEEFSEFPEEEEVLFPLNSHFKVVAKLETLAEKAAALTQLTAYDLTDLDVYKLKQI